MISTTVMLVAGLTFVGVVVNDLYSSKKALAEQRLSSELSSAVKDIDAVFQRAERNVQVLAEALPTFIRLDPEVFQLKAASLSKVLLSPQPAEHSICWAFPEDVSKRYFGRPGFLFMVRKNASLIGHPSYGDPSTIQTSIYADGEFLRDREHNGWYHDTVGKTGIQYTPFFYDPIFTREVMISLNQAVYGQNGELTGTVGVDIIADAFTANFQSTRIGQTGGVILVDSSGQPIVPLLGRDTPMVGFSHPKTGQAKSELVKPLVLKRPLPLALRAMQEYEGADGETYIVQSAAMESLPWRVVAYQRKGEAFSDPFAHTFTVIGIGSLVFFTLYFLTRLVSRTIAGSVNHLVRNMDDNADRVEKSQELLEVAPRGPYEFRRLGSQLNRMYAKLEATLVQLKDALTRAENATQAKSRFLSVMSHEIRTPLNSMIGLTDVLLLTEVTSEQHRHLRTLQRSGQSLLRILNDILDFSRLESGRLAIETHDFDLYELVRSVDQLMRFDAEAKGLQLKIQIPSYDYILHGDSVRLRQVLLNLIGNAIKFTTRGHVEVRVSTVLEAEKDRQQFLFEVIDTGIGISDEQKPRIFEEFSQADASISRRFGGTGLGLSISRQLTDLMGGKLQFVSQAGEGSNFFLKLELPVRRRFTADFFKEEPLDQNVVAPDGANESTKFILVVDDDEDNHRLMDAYLKFRKNVRVAHAYSAKESIVHFQKTKFDLVIMDLQMPEMDGLEAVRELRRLEAARAASESAKKRCSIVVLSANTFSEDRAQSLEAGADDHVGKPIKLDTFNRVLKSWL